MSRSGFAPIIVIFIVVFAGAIIAILAGIGVLPVPFNSSLQGTPRGSSKVTMSLTATPTQNVRFPGATEFRSNSLGIAFYYLPTQNGVQIKTKEAGNKVYIYSSNMKADDGQSVEVFTKPADADLVMTIQKRFLPGKSSTECWSVDRTPTYHYPANFRAIEITFPKPTDSQEPWWALGEKCSQDYAQSNGIRYFLQDTNHPATYVFFNIGQYGIMAGDKIPWQDTIRFF